MQNIAYNESTMKLFRDTSAQYLDMLAKRKKDSRVYREFQLIGLAIAQLLGDRAHKSLYIKLAKQYGKQRLLPIAKDVAERKNVKNKGAYFMRLLQKSHEDI